MSLASPLYHRQEHHFSGLDKTQ